METWDAVVIGAGPAGMAAAELLANSGASTLILDENAAPGGQIYRGVETVARFEKQLLSLLGPDYARGLDLVSKLRHSRAQMQTGSFVWQLEKNGSLVYSCGGRSKRIAARRIVVATGAMERPVPIKGWTLPGVTTAGALQILLKTGSHVPTGSFVLVGAGPLLLLLAKQLAVFGRPPKALIDTTPYSHYVNASRYLLQSLGRVSRSYLNKGIQMQLALHQNNIPVYRSASRIEILGEDGVERVAFTHRGKRKELLADMVGLHEGVIPSQQIARLVGCDFFWNSAQQCFVPVTDPYGRSSVPHIYIAGDGAGIAGALAAEYSGRIAAFSILKDLDLVDAQQHDQGVEEAIRARSRHTAIRPLLDALCAPVQEVLTPHDDVIVCRCEEIDARAIRLVASTGCLGPNQAKAYLRCGMGPCQGRLCGPTVTNLIARETGRSVEQVGYYNIRPPLKPLGLTELAEAEIE